MKSKLLSSLRNFLSSVVIKYSRILRVYIAFLLWLKNMGIKDISNESILITKDDKGIIISKRDLHYCVEIRDNFDFLFNSVAQSAVKYLNYLCVNFSKPQLHTLNGWQDFEVWFPSFAEPTETTLQYIDYLGLKKGFVVFDLGAYAGVSSMQFMDCVGREGVVIAVEADAINIQAIKKNFTNYLAIRGFKPDLLEAAAWNHTGKIGFTTEGNVGSAVAGINSRKLNIKEVDCVTLTEIVKLYGLDRVDAIKLDIEGAEFEVFQNEEFFKIFKPKIIFEAILTGPRSKRYLEAIELLKRYGYICEVLTQYGSRQMLVGAKFENK